MPPNDGRWDIHREGPQHRESAQNRNQRPLLLHPEREGWRSGREGNGRFVGLGRVLRRADAGSKTETGNPVVTLGLCIYGRKF